MCTTMDGFTDRDNMSEIIFVMGTYGGVALTRNHVKKDEKYTT